VTTPDAASADPELCIVIPAYNEALNLGALYREVTAALGDVGISWSFLFIDDGSADATAEVLAQLRASDQRVTFIRLARNFGLQSALAAGLECARGRAVVIMDADLQDDPAALREFVATWRSGADVVYAIRTSRKEGFVRRALFKGFHALLSRVADIPIPRDAGSFALYDRRVVDHINSLPERNRYLPGLRAWVGFHQVGIPVERCARRAGTPGQSFGRLVSLALDGILSFSKVPLRLATMLGFSVTGLSLIAVLVVAYWRFVQRSFPSGVGLATIALSLLFLGGVQLLIMGILGEYLGRVYDEVKRRPLYIISESQGVRR
jgi:polyisoprenyl-phosphate glycosyltransferase